MNPPSSGGAATPRLVRRPMQPGVSAPASRAGWIGAASATAAIAAYVVACLVAGVSVDVRERDSAILIFGALALAAAALVGWRRAIGRADAAARALEEERTRQAQAERELRDVAPGPRPRARPRTDRFRNDLSREEARAEGLERLHTAERRWHATLRDRVEGMHRQEGGEGDLDRVREVLLGTSLELSGATKGMLITRRPGDVGGHMDVVAAQGVQPAAGEAQAERFAADPIPAETVIREKGDLGDTVIVPIHQRDRFHGVLIAAGRRGGFAEHDDAVLVAVGEHIGAILQTERVNAELRGVLRRRPAHARGGDRREGSDAARALGEVARFAGAMGRRLDIEPDEQRLLSLASLLHDVGTVGVSERVLLKPGPLNAQEREVVEEHPRIGAQVVSQVPALRPLAPAILHHHERYDGPATQRARRRRHPRPRAPHRGRRRVQRDDARPSPPIGAGRRQGLRGARARRGHRSSIRRWSACSWTRSATIRGSSKPRGARPRSSTRSRSSVPAWARSPTTSRCSPAIVPSATPSTGPRARPR